MGETHCHDERVSGLQLSKPYQYSRSFHALSYTNCIKQLEVKLQEAEWTKNGRPLGYILSKMNGVAVMPAAILRADASCRCHPSRGCYGPTEPTYLIRHLSWRFNLGSTDNLRTGENVDPR